MPKIKLKIDSICVELDDANMKADELAGVALSLLPVCANQFVSLRAELEIVEGEGDSGGLPEPVKELEVEALTPQDRMFGGGE